MSKSAIRIEEIEAPNVLIDESKYELLCEIQGKDGSFQSFFVKEGGTDVVVEVGKENAVVGLFSTEESKLRHLFDYIEASVSPDDGLICYESEDFPRFLKLAAEVGGRYPLIQNGINPQKNKFISGILQQLRPRHFLNEVMREQIQEHTVPCTHVAKEDLQHLAAEDSLVLPTVSPAASLPDGWTWKEYGDGSGHLESPEGKRYFDYDRCTYYPGGIEYKATESDAYGPFWGAMSEFIEHAESRVSKEILQIKEALDVKIQSAATRGTVNCSASLIKDRDNEPSI